MRRPVQFLRHALDLSIRMELLKVMIICNLLFWYFDVHDASQYVASVWLAYVGYDRLASIDFSMASMCWIL
jgi:hypothetical protein